MTATNMCSNFWGKWDSPPMPYLLYLPQSVMEAAETLVPGTLG